MAFSDFIPQGSSNAFQSRKKALYLFEKSLSRPWMGCELVMYLENTQGIENNKRTEYDLITGEKSVKDNYAGGFSSDPINSAVIQSLTIPNIGMDFVVNQAMAGNIQPQINYGVAQISFHLPTTPQTILAPVGASENMKRASALGSFGILYERQFNSYGTLSVMNSKPNVLIGLHSNILESTDPLVLENFPSFIALYKLKGCVFTQPTPQAGSSSDNNALGFLTTIAFDDYDIMNGIYNKPKNDFTESVNVRIGGVLENPLTILAKTLVASKTAKILASSTGNALGFKYEK